MNEHIHMPKDHMDALYNSRNPLVRFVHRDRLDKIFAQVRGKKILDAGCGEGHLLKFLSKRKAEYFGIDITDVALEKARIRFPEGKFYKMDLTKLEFPDESFDCITCSEVLEHIYLYKDVLKELIRVLKKDGLLIITFPNETNWTISRFFLGRRPIKVPDHVNSFNPKMMRKVIKLNNIKVENMPYGFPFFLSLGSLMVFRK
jgi:ubiquinone/menaquinone biosynthesis C-methylase UbiE